MRKKVLTVSQGKLKGRFYFSKHSFQNLRDSLKILAVSILVTPDFLFLKFVQKYHKLTAPNDF